MVIRFPGGNGGNGGEQGWRDQGLIRDVESYWETLRTDADVPRRSQIDPRGLSGALDHAFLLERIGPGLARFRIAGLALRDLAGMDLRGLPISALFMGDARPRLQMDLERMFHGPAKLTLALRAPGGFRQDDLLARAMILPLRGDGNVERCDLALGCLELAGRTTAPPRRFHIDTARIMRIPRPAPDCRSAAPGWVEPPATVSRNPLLDAPPLRRAGAPLLRLVHSAG